VGRGRTGQLGGFVFRDLAREEAELGFERRVDG
jgi:hypothetical protein